MTYDNISSKITEHTEKLEVIYHQRRLWLYASSFVYVGVLCVIVGWDYISKGHNKIWWFISSISLIISVNWWYWTMRALATLVQSLHFEYTLLTEITHTIRELKQLFKEEPMDIRDILNKLNAIEESALIDKSTQLDEKAVSKSQQRFMGMVHAAHKGKKPASKEVAKVAKGMTKKSAKDFASTKHKGLPNKKKKD